MEKDADAERWKRLRNEIEGCEKCPRLRTYGRDVARKKKREFAEWDYWGKPVPGFGDPRARLWIVGLAPAAHGANRTGRMFTGDSSGNWLYRALHRSGFCNQPHSVSRDDGLKLFDTYISACVRCAPPDNKPLPEEKLHCAPYLDEEYRLLTRVELFVALGAIGFNATLDLVGKHSGVRPRPRPIFKHGELYSVGGKRILVSYHPSRQNTQTGVLTEAMWFDIFDRARRLLSDKN